MKELYACVYANEFPVQALLRLRPELRRKPCVVMDGVAPEQTVCSLNPAARQVGLTHRMTRVEVEAFDAVTMLQRSFQQECSTKAALLESIRTFSPRMEDHSDDTAFVCLVDISGTERLFGLPPQFADRLLKQLSTLGISARIAISHNAQTTLCLAYGMSSSRRVCVVPYGEEATSLASLPLTVLPLFADHAETFANWGIRTLGMLAALPEQPLIARLGQEGKRLLELARGKHPHLFLPMEPVFSLEERMELDAPVELLDSLIFILAVMLKQLITRAVTRILALVSVTLTLDLDGGGTHTCKIQTALPANDHALWLKLLHLELQRHPPSAAVLAITLQAEPGKIGKVQLGLYSPQLPEFTRLDVTLARIHNIVGEDRIGRAVLNDTHRPDSFQMLPFELLAKALTSTEPQQTTMMLRQIRPPETITVIQQSHRPASLYFRNHYYSVEHAHGPWLGCGNWWDETRWNLEQWDLIARAEDTLLYCAVAHNCILHQWQMTALYD